MGIQNAETLSKVQWEREGFRKGIWLKPLKIEKMKIDKKGNVEWFNTPIDWAAWRRHGDRKTRDSWIVAWWTRSTWWQKSMKHGLKSDSKGVFQGKSRTSVCSIDSGLLLQVWGWNDRIRTEKLIWPWNIKYLEMEKDHRQRKQLGGNDCRCPSKRWTQILPTFPPFFFKALLTLVPFWSYTIVFGIASLPLGWCLPAILQVPRHGWAL